MNKYIRTTIATALLLIMAVISPMTDLSQNLADRVSAGVNTAAGQSTAGAGVNTAAGQSTPVADMNTAVSGVKTARAAEKTESAGSGQLYISDLRIGNAYYDDDDGPTEDQVIAELERDGYTVLRDGSGYADLNSGADAPSIKEGPTQKKVFLGYKTTTDPNEAITDLAVMNMNGGYSPEDYETLLKTQMNTQIRPFVKRFIATMKEYRENYKKPEDSINHIRADKVRRYLNCFTDDDTGGKPIGDLLLNETKYEMGDAAYNALSAEEKKNHADILTMLMQGNGNAILTIERLVTMASDAADDNWFERFVNTSVDDLVEEIRIKKPKLMNRTDIYRQLDKEYEDKAKQILDKWNEFRLRITNYEENAEEIPERITEAAEKIDRIENKEEITEGDLDEFADANAQILYDADRVQNVYVAACLEATPYEEGSLLDFFEQDYDKVSDGDGIRKLYPLVAALSAGQIAGLEFISMEDLFAMALTGKEGYEDYKDETPEVASVYEGINREIFAKGGVALTTAKLRAKSLNNSDEENIFGVSDMSGASAVSWGATALFSGLLAYAVTRAVKLGKVAREVGNITVNHVVSTAKIPQRLIVFDEKLYHTITESAHWNDSGWLSIQIDKIKSSHVQDFAKSNPNYSTIYQDTVDQINQRITELKDAEKATTDATNVSKASETASSNASWAKWMAVGLAVIVVILIAVSTYLTISDVKEYYKTDYVPIPNYIVDEVDITAYNERGEKIVINNQTAYYKAVTCNRIEGNSDQEKNAMSVLGNKADLNGDIGKEWLALYYAKNACGTPILADSLLYRKGGGELPSGYTTGIHEFGSRAVMNLNKKVLLYSSAPPEINVFFKNDTSDSMAAAGQDADAGGMSADAGQESGSDETTIAGSIIDEGGASSAGSGASGDDTSIGITPTGVALGGGIGIVLGGLLGILFMYFSKKRKVSDKA